MSLIVAAAAASQHSTPSASPAKAGGGASFTPGLKAPPGFQTLIVERMCNSAFNLNPLFLLSLRLYTEGSAANGVQHHAPALTLAVGNAQPALVIGRRCITERDGATVQYNDIL